VGTVARGGNYLFRSFSKQNNKLLRINSNVGIIATSESYKLSVSVCYVSEGQISQHIVTVGHVVTETNTCLSCLVVN
jgi:hypothetical protein